MASQSKGKQTGQWEAALQRVQSHILSVTSIPAALSLPQKKALWGLYIFCKDRIAAGPPPPAPTNRELASRYGVSLRTVTNWRREGCPFDGGQIKVLDWLAERRYAPAGTREKFSGQLTRRKGYPFISRDYWKAHDQARQFKRDCLTHGYEPPSWLKGFRATRRTKGIPDCIKPKQQGKGKRGVNHAGK